MRQIAYLNHFKCLQDKCPDTCCSQWNISITNLNKEFLQENAPEIIDDILEGGSDGFQMKRTFGGDCVQLEAGLCMIHKKYGEEFLPDICHDFPKSFKKFGDEVFVVANLACPESLRVALYNSSANDFTNWEEVQSNRIREDFQNYKTGDLEHLSPGELIEIYNETLKIIDDDISSAEDVLARLLFIAQLLDKEESNNLWSRREAIYAKASRDNVLQIAKDNLPKLDIDKEIMNVLNAIFGLIYRNRPRYYNLIQSINEELGNKDDDPKHATSNYQKLKTKWQGNRAAFDPILKNVLRIKLSLVMFPIGSSSGKRYPTILNIALEYLVIKTALMCMNSKLEGVWTEQDVIETIQPITRQFHVRSPKYLFDFCEKCGWDDHRKAITLVLNY